MTKDWSRLARAVAARRRELGLSQDAIRRADGPSAPVTAAIENNEEPHPRDDTINKLDGPLRWEPGSAQRVLAGGDPEVIERAPDLRKLPIDALLAEIRRRVPEEEVSPSGARVVDFPAAEDERKKIPMGRHGAAREPASEDRQHYRQ